MGISGNARTCSIYQFLEWFPGVTRAQVEVLLDRALASLTQMAQA